MSKRPVAIVGARGYSGVELARILLRHPFARIEGCFATDPNFRMSDYLPELDAQSLPTFPMSGLTELLETRTSDPWTVFLATPAETSMELAPRILKQEAQVIDLSGAFRLDAPLAYEDWYGFRHSAPNLLAQARYGLVPWCGPASGAITGQPRLIANPGCYATSILMAIIPLLKHRLIDPATLVIDAKSGTSGAGRKASEGLLFTEVDGECLPYRVGKHQHLPEIRRFAEAFGGLNTDPFFSTSLLNVRRGIISGIYARVAPGVTTKHVQEAFEKSYEGYPLVRFGQEQMLLSLKKVVGSARTHIWFQVTGDKLYLHSSIDNLLKGAASQAVENFNLLSDLPVGTGLTSLEGVL